jgi:sigma-B regulation protein RsbU (phosphoserine phosphatase)
VDNTQRLTQITAEKERFDTELKLASTIQETMLPNEFPPYPDRSEFEIYASMDPAKAVGGDFYNFFLIDEDHLGIVMADVSGKGIPAALFMMKATIIISQNAKAGKSPAQILEDANKEVCRNNPMQLFVTVWVGILEISTGRLVAANAGHEYPVLKDPEGGFELVKDKHGFVIGGMEGMKYRDYEWQLKPGSKLFLYTDGVTEATDMEDELFGVERMLDALNEDADAAPDQLLRNVRGAVNRFVKDAEQFDDLTMLCLEYTGQGEEL